MNSFLQGRKALAVESLHPIVAPVSPGALAGAAVKNCLSPNETPGATVAVVKEGDKVVRLAITCTCGGRIDIDCLYPAGS